MACTSDRSSAAPLQSAIASEMQPLRFSRSSGELRGDFALNPPVNHRQLFGFEFCSEPDQFPCIFRCLACLLREVASEEVDQLICIFLVHETDYPRGDQPIGA